MLSLVLKMLLHNLLGLHDTLLSVLGEYINCGLNFLVRPLAQNLLMFAKSNIRLISFPWSWTAIVAFEVSLVGLLWHEAVWALMLIVHRLCVQLMLRSIPLHTICVLCAS